MDYILGKNVLIQYKKSWVEMKKVCHEKEKIFKVQGENKWYSKERIIMIRDKKNENYQCLHCKIPINDGKLLCKDTYCPNEYVKVFDCGFFTSTKNKEKENYRDRRITKYSNLRENLWSRNDPVEENLNMKYSKKLYSIKLKKFLPKSRFADRRLKWSNRGKRYNLHSH